ncbi:MAG: phosphatase PAP2 family protein [Bacteroidales bacterium]|nr:phosphatase PAP2 family protein [Bacteroidales bacterium]
MKYLIILLLIIANTTAQAQFVEKSTTALCLIPSATAAINTLARHDRRGMLQLALSSATCLAVNYGLEAAITKDRPDGTGHHSFPSTHTVVAFNGATFLTRRYGWKWGIPAYAIAAYVGWGRVHADRHDWWDVLGGAAIGTGTALIFARPLEVKNADISLSPIIGDGKYGMSAAIIW